MLGRTVVSPEVRSAFSLGSAAYHAGTRQAAHDHDELQITVVLRGSVEERVGPSVEQGSALSVVVKDPGLTHANHFGQTGAATAQLSIEGVTFADLVEHSSRALDWRWIHVGGAAAPFLRIVARGLEGQRQFTRDDDDIIDLVAIISARRIAQQGAGRPAWLEEAVAKVREEWQPELSVRDVARAAGVHPVYFARCVRRWYGTAAADLLRQSRLRHATHRIANGDPTIATVAHATGFADESHLCREFSRAAGLSPARFRRLAHAFGSTGRVARLS